jgi:hypothetical protein
MNSFKTKKQESFQKSNIKTIINLVKNKFLTRTLTISDNKNPPTNVKNK